MYSRSGFRSGGTSAKTTLLETTLLSPSDKRAQTQARQRAQKGAKKRNNCKQPGLKQPGLGTLKVSCSGFFPGRKVSREEGFLEGVLRLRTPRLSPEMARPGLSTKNIAKILPKYPKCPFWLFFRYFGGIFLRFQNLGPGGIFSAFFMEILGRAISGLCNRSGHSQF